MAPAMTENTLCFISAKGGSGKTVTSSALGTFLAALSFRVLLVDTDAATNGMTLLYLEQLLGRRRQKSAEEPTGAGLFEAKEGVTPTLIEINENLHLVPASFTMKDTENTDLTQFEVALRTIFAGVMKYDFILLDAQAGTDSFAKTAAGFAEQCVIVSEYDPVSAQGIERLKVLFSKVMDPSTTWTLFNKVLPEFATAIGEGLSIARYLTPVPWDADVVRAFARRDLAINMRMPNPYTLAIAQVAYNLFPDKTGEAIEKWHGSALLTVTEPVEKRLADLQVGERQLQRKSARRRAVANVFAAIFTMTVIVGAFAILSNNPPSGGEFPVLVFMLSIGLVFYIWDLRLPKSQTEQMTLERLHEEQAKLKTTLEAAKGVLKFSRDAGYYERRRRMPSPTDSLKS